MKNPKVAELLSEGYTILDEEDGVLTLFRPKKPVNHALHAILTIFTGLLWSPVWIAVAAGGGSKTAVVQKEI